MDNNLLKYIAFVETVELGSFKKAAQKLNYAQSSISKMIADLEKEWGVILLERSRAGICLTSSGEQILPYVRNIINDYRKLDDFVNQMNGIETGMVRIGTFSSVAINWLPDIFAEFQKDYPGIEYELLLGDYDEVERWIAEGRVDCGFLRKPSDTSLYVIELKDDEYKVVLPVGHPLAKEKKIRIEELNDQPFLLLEHGGKTEVSDILEQSNVHPDIRFTTWEDFAIMSMVEKGLGIGILPDMILKRIPYQLEVRPLAKPYYRKICLAVKNKEQLTPATRKFMEYLQARIRL